MSQENLKQIYNTLKIFPPKIKIANEMFYYQVNLFPNAGIYLSEDTSIRKVVSLHEIFLNNYIEIIQE